MAHVIVRFQIILLHIYAHFMSLTKNQIKFLRTKCHELKPVIRLGQKGFTTEVLNELEIALDHHELVKIKLAVDDKDLRKKLIDEICEKSSSMKIQTIGKTASVFRQNKKEAVITLPKK